MKNWIFLKLLLLINLITLVSSLTPEASDVKNIVIRSKFPDAKVNISFQIPTFGGPFLKYRISVLSAPVGSTKTCIGQWIITCSDCSGSVGSEDKSNLACPSTIDTKISYSLIQFEMMLIRNDIFLKPVTLYEFVIQAGNSRGWGSAVSKTFTLNQYKSDAVQNMDWKFNIQQTTWTVAVNWTSPLIKNGPVQQYQIWLTNSDGYCLAWYRVTCENCGTLLLGTAEKKDLATCLNQHLDLKYKTLNEIFINVTNLKLNLATMSSKSLIIHIVPVNGYGWGTEKKMNQSGLERSSKITGKSEAVRQIEVQYSAADGFFNYLNISWLEPIRPNGIVTTYNGWINTEGGKCILWFQTSSGDSVIKTIGSEGQRNLSDCINKITWMKFYEHQNEKIEINILHLITDIKGTPNLTLYVVPVNEYGWGEESSMSFQYTNSSNLMRVSKVEALFYLAVVVILSSNNRLW